VPACPSDEIPSPSEGPPSKEVDARTWPTPQIKLQSLVLGAVTKAQPNYEPLLESLPTPHKADARAVVSAHGSF
jgi:hypothetical protein